MAKSLFETAVALCSKASVQVTLLYSVYYLWIGALVAAPGPALLALSRQTGGSLTSTGLVFTARAFAYMCGSMSGLLFDRYDAHRLIAGALALAALGTLCIPLAQSLTALAFAVACQGLVCGFLDCGINVLIFIVHAGARVEPYMQTVRVAVVALFADMG